MVSSGTDASRAEIARRLDERLGDPLERDPKLVALDVQEGYVSVEAARDSYGVITSPGGILDERATLVLRKRLRKEKALRSIDGRNPRVNESLSLR